jgi:hypothetical protein
MGHDSIMKAIRKNPTNSADRSNFVSTDPGFETATPGINRREFFNVGLAGAALLALTGCATFQGSKKSDLDQATTDLRKLLEGFEGDGARQARLASIGHRIENRCREVIELKSDFIRRFADLSRRRETPSAELSALVEDFSVRRVTYRDELFGVQDELRQALTREEWDQAVQVLNSGANAFSQTRIKRS